MIPKINNRGHSFKGITEYLMHDKNAATHERVEWSMTGNMHTNNIEKAAKIMAFTDLNAEHTKRRYGGSSAGRKIEAGAVYHYSLSWATGETPSPAHQKEEALKTLEKLGLSKHQYYLVSHNDTEHKHVHIIANLTHQDTGKRHTPSFDKKELSKYALAYEKSHTLHCNKRLENEQMRNEGKFLKHQDTRQEYAKRITEAYHKSDNGKSFKVALTEAGLTLAQGRRGSFVLVDETGNIQKLARQIDGVKTAEIKAKLADIDLKKLQDADTLSKERQHQDVKEKSNKENHFNDTQQSRDTAEKQTDNKKLNDETKAENWDRDKADQEWKDSIAAAGIKADKQQTDQKSIKDKTLKPTPNISDKKQDSYAKYLDQILSHQDKEFRQRYQLEDELKKIYTRQQTQQDLKEAKEREANSNTLFGRLNGKHQQALDDVEAYQKNLANITQRENERRGALDKKLTEEREKIGDYQNNNQPTITKKYNRIEDMLSRAELKSKEKRQEGHDKSIDQDHNNDRGLER